MKSFSKKSSLKSESTIIFTQKSRFRGVDCQCLMESINRALLIDPDGDVIVFSQSSSLFVLLSSVKMLRIKILQESISTSV
jgi:hypothetical protein